MTNSDKNTHKTNELSEKERKKKEEDQKLDKALKDTFPASDPPTEY